MPLTILDPRTALVVIDLQSGIVNNSLAHPVTDIVARSAALARAFRAQALPVVLVRVKGAPPGRTERDAGANRTLPDDFAELVPELDPQPGDLILTKYARSAFTSTGLTETLRELGVTQIVVTGISTSGGVESTGRDAHEHGFNVTFALDAMTDRTLQAHEHSIGAIFPRIGETGSTEKVLDLLAAHR